MISAGEVLARIDQIRRLIYTLRNGLQGGTRPTGHGVKTVSEAKKSYQVTKQPGSQSTKSTDT